jgi:hypothetical protein
VNTDQFRQQMASLPEPKTTLKPPFWEHWRLDLWQRAQAEDPTRFWEWPCIYHTMMVNHWPFQIDYEFSQLTERFHDAIVKPHFGPDDPFGKVIVRHPFSMNLIHQAYHLTQWERATGQRIEQLETIVEFGGGYGAMALLCKRMGFEGKYIIYDLPEFSLLQEYYLSQFGMLNGVEWNPKRKPKDVDLFMALYSLSEVEPSERSGFIQPYAKSFLCLYSGKWEQWDNVDWFKNVLPKIAQYIKQWRHTEISHLPDKWNFYSIGWQE